MMIKKVICGIALCAIMANDLAVVNAEEREEIQKDGYEDVQNIDELYELRSLLSVDFDKNLEQIEEIDRQLEALGVEEITQEEVAEKLGVAKDSSIKSRIAVSSSSTVKWTSVREQYVYQGKSYELQIIRGVPNESYGESWRVDTQARKTNAGFVAASKNALKVITSKILGQLPKVGGAISTAKTFFDVFNGIISGLSTTSTIEGVDSVYMTSMKGEFLYVFVKYSGDVDAGNQILGYGGSTVQYETSININQPLKINGQWTPNISVAKVTGTITSPYYSSGYRNIASNVFWNYKNGNSSVNGHYELGYVDVDMLGEIKRLEAPYAFPN